MLDRVRSCVVVATALVLSQVAGQECDVELGVSLPFKQEPWSLLGTCSGRGSCNDTLSSCVCEPGWTGRSDFLNTEGIDCQINELAIKVEWGICLAVTLYSMAKSFRNIQARFSQYKDIKAQQEAKGRRYPLWRNRGLVAVLAYSMLCFPALVGFAILRMVDDTQRIGLTAPATVLFAITRLGFYLQIAAFQPALLASILQGSKKDKALVKSLVRLSNVFAGINLVLSTICSFIPFITLANGGKLDQLALQVYMLYMGATLLTLVFYGLQAVILLKRSSKMLSKSFGMTKDERILKIKDAIARSQKEGIRQAFVQAVIYLIFLMFPFLYNKHDYFLPIGWLAYPIVAKKIAQTAVVSSTTTSKTGGSSRNTNDNSSKEAGSFKKNGDKSFSSFTGTHLAPASSENFEPSLRSTTKSDKTLSMQFRNGVNTFVEEPESDFVANDSDDDLV